MAEITVEMVNKSVESFVNRDLELAKEVISRDDEVDALFLKVRKELTVNGQAGTFSSDQALDLLIKNGVCDKHQNEIMCKLPINTKIMLQKGFIFSAIEETKTYTDRQFLKEVISIV